MLFHWKVEFCICFYFCRSRTVKLLFPCCWTYTTAVNDNLVILAHWEHFHPHPHPFSFCFTLNYIHTELGLTVQWKCCFEHAVEFGNSSGLEIISKFMFYHLFLALSLRWEGLIVKSPLSEWRMQEIQNIYVCSWHTDKKQCSRKGFSD